MPFTKANLERICDDALRFVPKPAPALLDGRKLTGATRVSTAPFTSRVKPVTKLLYQDSVDLGHPGRLATAYCGWKAKVALKRGHHVIKVDLTGLIGAETVITYKIDVVG